LASLQYIVDPQPFLYFNFFKAVEGPLEFLKNPVAGVLDESYSKLSPLSGVVVQARQSIIGWNSVILCSLAGRYGYSAERA